jgi:hypothetical protein
MAAGSLRDFLCNQHKDRVAAGVAGSATIPMLRSLVFMIVFARFMPLTAGDVMALARAVGLRVALVPVALAVIRRHAGDPGTLACFRPRPVAGLGQCREAEKSRKRPENDSLSHCLFSAVPCWPDIRPGRR